MPRRYFARTAANNDPGGVYQTVDISSTDFTPTGGRLIRGIWVGVAGNIVLQDLEGNNATFVAVPIGLFPCGGAKVIKTSTTATTMIAILDN